ncbi:acetyl-CoA carboxylase carboxyl transferase subunit beta [Halopolyspora algeriensis]|uniref:Acetyl-coenzyme A carboxylase carboxyl transferase subunits beta/alpha n=1 Tax=Halopolyspora algeriensis TaxID=1500506 RepID=A0A368VDX3_9ACTN|nr:carboxyl transferase domain-containing protein [Halopolyspora algeriensis]RCW38435.1 acetyl-CoA carboxylase carboxyl transferase subunit beta [Halopolyspora algeriensis]TQM55750.1 acetyl-CoA carboxylase carboxyl transferase subunit beta [Halopolyspora algeriensis]
MVEPTGTRALIERLCTRFREWQPEHVPETGQDGPLNWPGYDEQRALARKRSGADESVVCGHAWIGAQPAVLIAFEFGFLGGSVGHESGARIVSAFTRARRLRIPVVSLVASGGSRVQEGICALRQLQEITRACLQNRKAGLPHITVLRNPTTGGMWASLAAGADLVLASPEAAVAFGGSRVRSRDEPDDAAFTAEGKFAAGQADLLVADSELAEVLTTALTLLGPGRSTRSPEPAEVPAALGRAPLPDSGWTAVQRARAPARPRAEAYLDDYFTTRLPINGDRAGGTDTGMWCGFGERHGRTVAYAAQTGTATAPAGFRTATRVIRLADRFGMAVLTLVDTPGAANTAEAERDGVGPAIAELFTAVAEATVPVTTLVIGEGGSGGALALAAPERTWITPDAYFAVIAPEAGAAILKRGHDDVAEVADRFRLRPQDLLELGFVRGIASPVR